MTRGGHLEENNVDEDNNTKECDDNDVDDVNDVDDETVNDFDDNYDDDYDNDDETILMMMILFVLFHRKRLKLRTQQPPITVLHIQLK